jgi:DNA-binding SARP family transcriptional activator
MARLSVALLGSLHVSLNGEPTTSFGYDKVRALLAYLLIEGDRPLGRDALAALLWPDAPAGAARKNLRTALAILRQTIGDTQAQTPILRIERDSIQRNPHADVALDVADMRAHVAAVERHAHHDSSICADCADRLARAAELYRGAFMQQISVPDSVAWEEWALLTREQLHGQLLTRWPS